MYKRKFKTRGMSYAKCQTVVRFKPVGQQQKKTLNETTAQTTRSIHMHIVSNANFHVIRKMDLACTPFSTPLLSNLCILLGLMSILQS